MSFSGGMSGESSVVAGSSRGGGDATAVVAVVVVVPVFTSAVCGGGVVVEQATTPSAAKNDNTGADVPGGRSPDGADVGSSGCLSRASIRRRAPPGRAQALAEHGLGGRGAPEARVGGNKGGFV